MKSSEFFLELLEEGSIERVLSKHPDLSLDNVKEFFQETIRILKERENEDKWEVYVDGASSGNPGNAGIGVVIKRNGSIIKKLSKFIGKTTNNVAEYMALISGLEEAYKMGAKSIIVYSDSELVVKQVSDVYQVKSENLKSLKSKVLSLLDNFKSCSIVHIPRRDNKIADKLAKEASKNSTT